MLKIDCLIYNTALVDKLKKFIKSDGFDRAKNKKDASLSTMYRDLTKAGVEVDLESFAHIYEDQLPTEKDNRFTSSEDIDELVHRSSRDTIRNLTVHKPLEGEIKQGLLSAGKEIGKRFADAFSSKITQDQRTKSMLVQMKEIIQKAAQRTLGEFPDGDKKQEDKRSFEQVVADAVDHNNLGYTDKVSGAIIGIDKLWDHVKEVTNEYTKEIDKTNDPVLKAQWDKYSKEFREAAYTIALSSGEAKKVTEGALRESGYMKMSDDGREIVNWKKLSGEVNSIRQIKDNTIKVLKAKGIDASIAEKVADSLTREHRELLTKIAEKADAEQGKLKKTWEPKSTIPNIQVEDLISDQVKNWQNYIGFPGKNGEPLIISKKTASDALKNAIIKAGMSRAVGKTGKLTMSIDKLSENISTPADIKKITTDYFLKQTKSDGNPKYNQDTVERLSDAVNGMYQEMFNKVREHVEGKQAAIERTWDPSVTDASIPTPDEIINKRLKENTQYKKITGKSDAPLRFTKNEAQQIIGDVLKNDSEYGKKMAEGKMAIDWLHLAEKEPNGISLDAMARKHFIDNFHYSNSDAAEAASALVRDYHGELVKDIKSHADAILDSRTSAIDRDVPERKTAIVKLAELHALGIFDKSREKLLNHIIGVDQVNSEDLQKLKDIAGAVSDLRNETNGRDYLNSFAYQSADRMVAHIIERNKDDHSRLIKVTSAINHTFGLMNMSLIANPYNLIENNWSGQNALWGAKGEMVRQMGVENAKLFNDRKLWWSVWKDVAMGAVEYGGAGEKWSHIGSYVDNLNSVNFKKDLSKALKTSVIAPFRALLNGSDAANKAVLHQRGMLLMLHKAMTSQGMDSDEAAHNLHQALYGESFEQAKEKAIKLIDKYGDQLGIGQSEYARQRASVRWANDIVRANLNMSGDASINGGEVPIKNEDIIEAALSSSFHAAAVSLGHEANNPESKGIHAGKIAAIQEEKKLIEEENYSAAAWVKFKNNIYWNGIKRMQSGGMNWAVLRAEGLGLGLVSAFGGDYHKDLNFTSKELLERTMRQRILSSRKVTRAITNMTLSALTIAAIGGYGALRKKDDDEKDNEGAFTSGVKGIQKSYELNRIMGKAGPDLAFLYYLGMSAKSEGKAATAFAAIDYVKNLFNANPEFTFAGHVSKAVMYGSKATGEDSKGYKKMMGEFGKTVGDLYNLPLYKPFKQVYQIGVHHIAGAPIVNEYTKPESLAQGAIGGGALQDFVNYVLPDDMVQDLGLEEWKYEHKNNNTNIRSDIIH